MVEISGFSHFFGFEALNSVSEGASEVSEYLGIRPNWHVGMPIAKRPPDEDYFRASYLEFFRCCINKKG